MEPVQPDPAAPTQPVEPADPVDGMEPEREPSDPPPVMGPSPGDSGEEPPLDSPLDEPLVDGDFVCPAGFAEFGTPELVTGLELPGNVFGPALSHDGRTLVFSSIPSEGEDEDILLATRTELGAAFGPASPVEGLDVDGSTEGTPFLSADGLSLYFFSTRPGPGVAGDRDIWVAERSSQEAPFGEPVVVAEVNDPGLDHLPWVSVDHLTLMLVSARPSPNASSNLWVSGRGSTADPFSAPVEVAGINSPGRDEGFSLSRDGLTIIVGSNRAGAQGMDLWLASRLDLDSPFGEPRNLTSVNSAADDIDASLSSDERELFFASDRNGSVQLFRAFRDCASE